ncbi:HepT-like ribonuclease domain-containing protein [Thermoflexus hugenholtzii]
MSGVKRSGVLFLKDMLESIGRIEEYTSGLTLEGFLVDRRTQDAVLRNLEILGEAARNLPLAIRERYQDIPWAQIMSLRNRLIHGYFIVDYEIVWDIIKNDLPVLRERLKEILREVSDE